MTTLTTDIFVDERFTLLPFGVACALLFLFGLIVLSGLDRNRNKTEKEELVFGTIFFLMIGLGVAFLVMFIIDMTQMHNLENSREEALQTELIAEGYNNILDLNLHSYHSADKAEFTYLDGQTPVECHLIGDESKVLYKVVCFD